MLATNGQLPDAESITVERLTGNLRLIDAAAGAGQAETAGAVSAAEAAPMAAAPAYEIFGCGVKPALYAIGTLARRSARSRARWMSRWLVNLSRPRLA